MPDNLLRHEVSPYLLQHKDNPVHWRPWGPEALAEAKRSGKPILLSVGYAACHWCHVMAHESFEDPDTAAVMNRLFVNIKVDREERPDIDQIYMHALHALGEQGGWPLTMFLTPDGEPIWGGTYFPKVSAYGRPGLVPVLEEVARLFRDEPDKIETNRRLLMERLAHRGDGQALPLDRALLDQAAARLLGFMDPVNGGTAGAPKFPQASLIELFWRAGLRTGDSRHRDIALVTLRSLCQGGIYDHIGGGFARYSVDERWLVPHFEKMLYDNAQLLELMTHAWLATTGTSPSSPRPTPGSMPGDHDAGTVMDSGFRRHDLDGIEHHPEEGALAPLLAERIAETIAWLAREMRLPGGGFAASLDADSEGHEGKFYVWTREEVLRVLGAEEGAFFADVYDIHPGGNWEGVAIPNRLAASAPLSDADDARLAEARARLLSHRETRVRPATDDKVLADWNGLAIATLAFAGATFDRQDWIDLAADAFRFVAETMSREDRLAHAFRAGKTVFPGLATDYAAMVKAALALHAATLDQSYLARAESFAASLRAHHWDERQPGYYLSADDADALIMRPRSITDEATPSATSLTAANLVRLWHLTGKESYRRDADAILAANAGAIGANLFATTGLLNALDLAIGAVDVVIVTPEGGDAGALLATVRRAWTPNTILSVHAGDVALPADHPAAGKSAVDGRPTAYVCRGATCSLPVTGGEGLAELLG